MPRNGSGTYNFPSTTWSPAVNGVTATSTDYNTQQTDLAAAITQSLSADGQTPWTGNQNAGNNKLTNLATGTANTDAASMGNLNAVAGQAGGVGDRNLLINGNFALNQRAWTSGTATGAANTYTLDRWRVVTSGQSITFAAGTPDVTVTCPAGGLEQVIEAGMIAGGVYTLSWSGTATAKVNGVAITNGGNTSSLTANTAVTIQFASGTVTRAQFELGTSATPYQRRQLSQELLMARRYYFRNTTASQLLVASGLAFSTTNAAFVFQFPVSMRVAPTLSSANLFVTNGAGTLITPTGSAIGAGVDSALVQINVAGGLTVGQASLLYAGNGSGGLIAFDAEM